MNYGQFIGAGREACCVNLRHLREKPLTEHAYPKSDDRMTVRKIQEKYTENEIDDLPMQADTQREVLELIAVKGRVSYVDVAAMLNGSMHNARNVLRRMATAGRVVRDPGSSPWTFSVPVIK